MPKKTGIRLFILLKVILKKSKRKLRNQKIFNGRSKRMHKIYKIIDWVKKFKLTPKEMIEGGYPQDRKDIIIFKNRELAQEWSKKHIEPNLSQKTIKNL